MKSYTYDEIAQGLEHQFTQIISQEDVILFSTLTGDRNPLHLDESYAKQTQFKRPVVFGLLAQSLLSTLAGMYLPGKYSLILSVESNFKRPCFVGDMLTVKGVVEQKVDAAKMLILRTTIVNQKGEVLIEGKMRVQVLK